MIPALLKFSIPYSDNSGTKLEVQFNKEHREVHINQGGATAFISFDDFAWFMDALEEIAAYVEQAEEELHGSQA